MRIYSLLLLSCLGGFISSCDDSKNEVTQKTHFNLKEYVSQEVVRLKEHRMSLHKKIHRDNQTETRNITNVNWEQELKPFSECDLNKPAWLSAYVVDTLQSGDTTWVNYKTDSDKLPVHSMCIRLLSGELSTIDIITQKENNFYRSHQTLHYNPSSGYAINGEQKVILADETKYLIQGIFRK